MDIKSKKFSQNMALRVIIFLLCIGLFTGTIIGTIMTVQSIENSDYNSLEDLVSSREYLKSAELQYQMQDDASSVMSLLSDYKNEDNIKNGALIDENELNTMIEELFYSGSYNINGKTIEANPITINAVVDALTELGRNIDDSDYDITGDYGDPAVRRAFKLLNREQIAQLREQLIQQQLADYKQLKKYLEKREGLYYYANDGKNVVTNLDVEENAIVKAGNFKSHPAYVLYENGELEHMPDVSKDSMEVRAASAGVQEFLDAYDNGQFAFFMAYDEGFIAEKQANYTQAKDDLSAQLPITAGCALLTVILFIWLAVTTGQPGPDGVRKHYKLDKIWTELQLLAIGAALTVGVCFSADSYSTSYYYTDVSGNSESLQYVSQFSLEEWLAVGALTFIGAMVGLWFVLSCIRLLKSGTFLKNSLICKIIMIILHALKDIYNGGSTMRKVVLISLAVCLLSATVFLAPVVFIAIVVLAPKWVKKYEEIKKGVDEVKNGNVNYKIPVDGVGEFDELAKSINEISSASSKAIQNELKNQRMKTDLISNVSHDLKTPLTSMVTYVDLLKTEGLDSPNAPEYLDILDQKTNRLRHLTEDLFEAAKASSGAMPVRFEKVEMLSLINQGLGEMDQRIRESGLDFKLNAEKDKYYVLADGQLLWRVVENLLGNVLKYAQPHTRVYIDIKERGKGAEGRATMVIFEIKNVSKQELNMDPSELMERFKRGDESRTTEGSGLGLAIAKDLVRLQNGYFEIFIDGDLFKAQVMLSSYNGSEPQEQEPAYGESSQAGTTSFETSVDVENK